MKLGLLTCRTDVARAMWLAIPFHRRAPMRGATPETISLGDIARALSRR